MNKDLRAALEAAENEIEATNGDNLGDDCIPLMPKDEMEVRARHLRAWMKEKAGEELLAMIEAAYRQNQDVPDHLLLSAADREEVDVYELNLSPLFAALRERAEEADEMRERAKKAAAECAEIPGEVAESIDEDGGEPEWNVGFRRACHEIEAAIRGRLDALREIGGAE